MPTKTPRTLRQHCRVGMYRNGPNTVEVMTSSCRSQCHPLCALPLSWTSSLSLPRTLLWTMASSM
jgi:hypothetical protein